MGASGYNYYTPNPSLYERTVATVRSQLGEEGFEQMRFEGETMDFEQAVAHALSQAGAP